MLKQEDKHQASKQEKGNNFSMDLNKVSRISDSIQTNALKLANIEKLAKIEKWSFFSARLSSAIIH